MKPGLPQLLAQAIEDEAFAKKLRENPAETLEAYELTEEEFGALKGLHPGILQALRQRDQSAAATAAWWQPANFRETGAAALSIILVGLLVYATAVTFSQVKAVPLTYSVGDNVHQVVDTFDRAKDLFNILFPLFGAVVTFWMGITVEGRRADRNEAAADKANVEKESAETKAQTARQAKETAEVEARKAHEVAMETLLETEAALLEQAPAPGSGFERGGTGDDASRLHQAAVQNALAIVRAGRQKLSQ